MKKFLLTTCSLLVLCLFVAGALLWVYRAPLLSDYLSQKLEMEVRVGHLSLSSQGIVISEFTLHDPSLKADLSAQSLTLDAPLTTLFSNPLTIRSISLENPSLKTDLAEFNFKSLDSWFKLPNIVKKIAPKKKQKTPSSSSTTFIIHEFHATNIHVDIGSTTVDVPSLHLHDINSLKPLNADHLLTLLMTEILVNSRR